MMSSPFVSGVLVAFGLLLAPAAGNTFLAAHGLPSLLDDGDLLKELSSAVNTSHGASVEERAIRLEEALRPSFRAMPQGPGGRTDAAAVRYLLHRLFVVRHGWFVEGLHHRGDAWNASSPAALLRDVDGALEQRVHAILSTGGFTLKQVATLAAVLESLVHQESVQRLRSAYAIAGLSTVDAASSEAEVMEVMAIFMQGHVAGAAGIKIQTYESYVQMSKKIRDLYPNWDATMKWVQDIRAEVLGRGVGSPTSFGTTLQVLEQMSEHYGQWQNTECLDLKRALMESEESGTGRVRLTAFYESALAGNWQFSEKKVYLRQIGALDEQDALRPSVIIPNYINSPANCVGTSKFYSVCCIDECEQLMGQIEEKVAAPQATPGRLADIVRDIESSSVAAPHALPPALLRRLDEIAEHHGGRVPLHGRLFAQWLHHAYPRECQYPHVSGTSSPATPLEFTERHDEGFPTVDKATMRTLVREAKLLDSTSGPASHEDELPWSAEEELFVSRFDLDSTTSTWRSLLRGSAMVAAACSTAWVVVQAAFVADPQISKQSDPKYAV